MISKRKRNTILMYCMATVIMLCVLASNVFKVTTSLKTNTKKILTDNNYVETSEISYGLVAIEASSCMEDKNAQNVTEEKEEKKEESQEESNKETSVDKKESSTSNVTKTAVSNSNKTTSNTTTSNKSTSNKVSNKTTSNKSTSNKTSNKTTSNKSTSNKTSNKTTSNSTSTTTNNPTGQQIANYAKQFNGNPYVYGGTSLTKGADCSGFVQSVYKHFGIKLPRTASQQAKVGKQVSWNALQPGDLLFYGNHSNTKIAHVAIYIGNGKIIHAQTPSLGIGITTYNIMTKVTARRVV